MSHNLNLHRNSLYLIKFMYYFLFTCDPLTWKLL